MLGVIFLVPDQQLPGVPETENVLSQLIKVPPVFTLTIIHPGAAAEKAQLIIMIPAVIAMDARCRKIWMAGIEHTVHMDVTVKGRIS